MGFYDYRKTVSELSNRERGLARRKQNLRAISIPVLIIILVPIIIFFCRIDRTTNYPDYDSIMDQVIENERIHINLDNYKTPSYGLDWYNEKCIQKCGSLENYCLTVDSIVHGAVCAAVEMEDMMFSSFENLSRKEVKQLSDDIEKKAHYIQYYIEKMNILKFDGDIWSSDEMVDFGYISNTVKLYEDLREFSQYTEKMSDFATYTFRNRLIAHRKQYISVFERDLKNIAISRVALYENCGLDTHFAKAKDLKGYPTFGISYDSLPKRDAFYSLLPKNNDSIFGEDQYLDYEASWVPLWYPD